MTEPSVTAPKPVAMSLIYLVIVGFITRIYATLMRFGKVKSLFSYKIKKFPSYDSIDHMVKQRRIERKKRMDWMSASVDSMFSQSIPDAGKYK